MTKLILHIGTHKTGTTAIQSTLLQNNRLLAKRGIAYPALSWQYGRISRARNAYFLNRQARIGALPKCERPEDERLIKDGMEMLRKAVGSSDTVILSDERIWYEGARHKGYWKQLKKNLDSYSFSSIEIVLYIRRQDQFAASLWNQYVKGTIREARTFDEYLRDKGTRAIMDYGGKLKILEKLFGQENIRVRTFDRKAFPGGDVVKDFCACVGIDCADEFSRPDIEKNISLSTEVACIKNIINRGELAREIDNVFGVPAREVTGLQPKGPRKSQLSFDEINEVLAPYREGNERIAREYLGREDGVLFSEPSPDIVKYQSNLSQTEMNAILLLSETLCKERKERLELQARVNELERNLNATQKLASSNLIARCKRLARRVKRKLVGKGQSTANDKGSRQV